MKSRFDSHIQSTQQRVTEERESARKESKVVIDELNTKVQLKKYLKLALFKLSIDLEIDFHFG